MAEQKLTRPPESGPGSDRESWVAFAAQELEVPASEFADKTEWTRDKIVKLLDSSPKAYSDKDEDGHPTGVRVVPEADATKLRKAPKGVTVVGSAPGSVTCRLRQRRRVSSSRARPAISTGDMLASRRAYHRRFTPPLLRRPPRIPGGGCPGCAGPRRWPES